MGHMDTGGKYTAFCQSEWVHRTSKGRPFHLLPLDGIIVLLVFFVFILIYILNIRDAYVTGLGREEGKQTLGALASLRNMMDKNFPYLFLSIPALGILFFTVMPILFTITIAFTNYSAPDHIPPAKLVDWVGFKTFSDLIQLKSWSQTFYGVLTWTVIWAILATVTTYFGGVLVALLIEQRGIRFKKLWRTIFILPYAIPQIISLPLCVICSMVSLVRSIRT